MKVKSVLIPLLLMIAIFLVSILTLPVSADLELESITALNYVWQDDFDSTVLDPDWSWVREDSDHWSLTDNPGYLQITTQTGGVGGWANDQQNLLLTSAPSGDFQITTKVTINPSQNFQYAAIQVYQDDDNYVQINRAYANGDTVNFDLEIDGYPTNIQVAVPDTTLYLQIRREGNSYMGYYSTDGSTYNLVGEHIANLDYAAVGLGAANNTDGLPEIPADFDFFKIESEFPVYDYYFIDEFEGEPLHQLWYWVREDVGYWSLTDNQGYLRITTQEGNLGANDQNNILLTRAPEGDFQITTRVEILPTENFQHASLNAYQDDDNYVQINRAYAYGDTVNFDMEVGGTISNTQVTVPETDLFLRITKEGNEYSGHYSPDGVTWILVDTYTASLSPISVGVGAANVLGGAAEIPADFDFVMIEGNFPHLGHQFTDSFSDSTLDDRWSWVNENISNWSLTNIPGYMQIMTNDGGLDGENLLVHEPPFGDFMITTREVFSPTVNFQFAGIVAQKDADNKMQFGRAMCDLPTDFCVGNGIYFDFTESAAFGPNFSTSVDWLGEAYLRLVRESSTYSGFYSQNNAHWRLIGRHESQTNFPLAYIGLGAGQGLPAVPADFDFFTLHANWFDFLPLLLK